MLMKNLVFQPLNAFLPEANRDIVIIRNDVMYYAKEVQKHSDDVYCVILWKTFRNTNMCFFCKGSTLWTYADNLLNFAEFVKEVQNGV